MPLFGIIFGDTLGVLSDGDEENARAETVKYAMMFVGLGFYAFFTQFIQVGGMLQFMQNTTSCLD